MLVLKRHPLVKADLQAAFDWYRANPCTKAAPLSGLIFWQSIRNEGLQPRSPTGRVVRGKWQRASPTTFNTKTA